LKKKECAWLLLTETVAVVTVVTGIVTRTVEVATVTAVAVVKKVTVAVGVGMLRQLQALETCEHANCLRPGGALPHALGDAGLEVEGFAVVDDFADDELEEAGLEVTRAVLFATAPQVPGTVTLQSLALERSRSKTTYDVVVVSVTTSAVRVVVPTIVVRAEVSTVIDVVVSETSVFATEVAVVANVLVTVAVGILSSDEQNAVAVGAPLRLFTTAEISWHSSCFNWLRSRAFSATEVAAANDSRNGAKHERILRVLAEDWTRKEVPEITKMCNYVKVQPFIFLFRTKAIHGSSMLSQWRSVFCIHQS
jgi:hypothetical protein